MLGIVEQNFEIVPVAESEIHHSKTVSMPAPKARITAFLLILIAGFLGGLTGYAVGDLLGTRLLFSALGIFLGSTIGALGMAIIVSLALIAMIEWYPGNKKKS